MTVETAGAGRVAQVGSVSTITRRWEASKPVGHPGDCSVRAVNSGKAVAAALDFKEPHVISVLAQLLVSRGYGRRVSDAEVRNNPGLKDELCRYFGSDIRVKSACASSKGQDGEGRH